MTVLVSLVNNLIREEPKYMLKFVMAKVMRYLPGNVHIMISDIQ